MTYETFREKIGGYPLVSWRTLSMLFPSDQKLKVQLSRWRKKGKVISLNKNYLILNEADRKIHPSRLNVAYELYHPSYISLEYALSIHGLIPEKVTDITCVTSKKTMRFSNPLGVFSYRHIKDACYFGYTESKDENGYPYYVATPEKALLDFIYLNSEQFQKTSRQVLLDSYRLQNMNTLNAKVLLAQAKAFNNDKLYRVVKEVLHHD